MRKQLTTLSIGALALISLNANADEGMWPVSDPGSHLAGATVSLDFGCTGSMISDYGLLITNHHCAYSDIHSISTPEHDYLEDGFWAMNTSEETPIKGKGAWFLRQVIDVTAEAEELRRSEAEAGRGSGDRRIGWLLEKKYSEQTGLEASMAGMWKGEKHYIYLYEVYRDVRLVAAPPVSIGAYGGDTDNWEWPQHKGDFAIYRIYTAPDGSPAGYSPENIPLRPAEVLTVSTSGISEGDSTFIFGYPGRTDRYASSWSIHRKSLIEYPAMCRLQGARMEIMHRWMNSSPAIRLKYADRFFSISNAQELYEGQTAAVRRYGVTGIRQQEEARLWQWIEADSSRSARWGDLRDRMEKLYSNTDSLTLQRVYYREAHIRGSQYYLISARISGGVRTARQKGQEISQDAIRSALRLYAEMEPSAEQEMLACSMGEFLLYVDRQYWGEEITSIAPAFLQSPESVTDSLVAASFLRDSTAFLAFFAEKPSPDRIMADPLMRLFSSADFRKLNQRINDCGKRMHCHNGVSGLEREYTAALYQMRLEEGIPQYPDANSTMRYTYGTVGPLYPKDAVTCNWYSTARGILEKYDPTVYEFTLKPEYRALLEEFPDMQVNFLTDNDITGGNSGSPVLNSKGELIGLAFDGNKESLCSDVFFHPDYCKTVCVDIRYVLWILDRYAGMQWLLDEIRKTD